MDISSFWVDNDSYHVKSNGASKGIRSKTSSATRGPFKMPYVFWFLAGAAINLMDYSHYGDYTSWGLVFDGFLGSATSHILYTLTRFLDKEF